MIELFITLLNGALIIGIVYFNQVLTVYLVFTVSFFISIRIFDY